MLRISVNVAAPVVCLPSLRLPPPQEKPLIILVLSVMVIEGYVHRSKVDKDTEGSVEHTYTKGYRRLNHV